MSGCLIAVPPQVIEATKKIGKEIGYSIMEYAL